MAQPVAWMWTEFTGIGGSPLVRYSDVPPGHVTDAKPLFAHDLDVRSQAINECIAEADRLCWAIDNGGNKYRRPADAENVVRALRKLLAGA